MEHTEDKLEMKFSYTYHSTMQCSYHLMLLEVELHMQAHGTIPGICCTGSSVLLLASYSHKTDLFCPLSSLSQLVFSSLLGTDLVFCSLSI